jgi:hypothetical protein
MVHLRERDVLDLALHAALDLGRLDRALDHLHVGRLAVGTDLDRQRDLAACVLRRTAVLDRDRQAPRHDLTLAIESSVDLVHLHRIDLIAAAISRVAGGHIRVDRRRSAAFLGVALVLATAGGSGQYNEE